MSDMEKARRETLRWLILTALNFARPLGANEMVTLKAISSEIVDVTRLELRRELDYLEERGLVELSGKDSPTWAAKLTHTGIDVVEYTVAVEPGIARPAKYWL